MSDHLERSRRNFFTAAPGDRLADCRRNPAWIARALQDEHTWFVPVWRDRSLVRDDGAAAVLLRAHELPPTLDLARAAVLLCELDGSPCFAVEIPAEEAAFEAGPPAAAQFLDLRSIGGLLGAGEGGLLAYARAMLYWQRRHRHCGECGAPTRSEEAGHLRVCSDPGCGAKHFPRTDPAIIVLTTDGPGERALLGRQAAWAPGVYSCLAGFVEPGESLEHAVVREVLEEAGVRVGRVRYCSSQPWPFPSSLMLGFRAVAESHTIRSQDDELEDVRWLSRDDLAQGLRRGELALPRRISIAFRLTEEWFDEGGTPLARMLATP